MGGNEFNAPDRGFCGIPEPQNSYKIIEYKCNHCFAMVKVRAKPKDLHKNNLHGHKCKCNVGFLWKVNEKNIGG